MTPAPDALKDLLLDLIAIRGAPPARERLSTLETPDWDALQELVRQQRLGPLLHWRVGKSGLADAIPPAFLAWLGLRHRRATLRSLALRRELLRVTEALAARGIPCAALKGAWLAYHAYPQPGLRTMRDLDLLVPPARAIEAYQTLQGLGYVLGEEASEAEAVHVDQSKHLPILALPEQGVMVELHTLLVPPEVASQPGSDPAHRPDLWAHLHRQPGEPLHLTYLTGETQLLHIIVHAVYDHLFSNGPLSFLDVAYSLQHSEIDWDEFWKMAQKGEWTRGCQLMLRLADHFHGPLPETLTRREEWNEALKIESDFIAQCARQALNDPKRLHEAQLQVMAAGHDTLGKQLRTAWAKFFPSPLRMLRQYPVGSTWRLPLYYLLHWRIMAGDRIPAYWSARRQTPDSEVTGAIGLKSWLASRN